MSSLSHGYRNLTIAIVFLFPIYTLLVTEGWVGRMIELFLGLAILTSPIFVIKGRNHSFKTMSLPIIIIILLVIGAVKPELSWLVMIKEFLLMVFLLEVIRVIARHVFTTKRVSTADSLYGAVCIYLLTGVFFAHTYFLINLIAPNSYGCSTSLCAGHLDSAFQNGVDIYYSFVTLTTMGYGDVVPLSPFAGMIAVLEAIIGQMYVAIVVARLVGLYLLEAEQKETRS